MHMQASESLFFTCPIHCQQISFLLSLPLSASYWSTFKNLQKTKERHLIRGLESAQLVGPEHTCRPARTNYPSYSYLKIARIPREEKKDIEPQSSNSVPIEEISPIHIQLDACQKKTVHASAIATITHAQFVPGWHCHLHVHTVSTYMHCAICQIPKSKKQKKKEKKKD